MHDRKNNPVWGTLVRSVIPGSALLGLVGFTTQALAAAISTGPAAIDAGPFAVTPTTDVELKYRDNIYLQERNTTDSWILVARPAVNAALQDRENRYELNYRGEAGWYQENKNDDKNDYFDNTFSGNAHLEFTERWIAEAYASWAALHEDRGTGLSEGFVGEVLPEPIEYDEGNIGGSLQYGANEEGAGRLLFTAGYMDRQYQNFKELTRSRDREETTFSGTFFYPVAPKTDVLAEYAYKKIDYPNPLEIAPPLDSDENALWLGAEWEMTPNLRSTAKAGYVDKDFKSSQRKDWDGLGLSVQLWMQPREQDTINLQVSRQPAETNLQGDFIKREVVTAYWTHNWSDRVFTEVGGLAGRDTYEESVNDREDDIYNLSFKVGYEFRRWANVYASYSYDDKDSNAENLSYTDNTFLVGVELSL